jgi:GR25 family glycosyltransferase involved in LPS biosynthesis
VHIVSKFNNQELNAQMIKNLIRKQKPENPDEIDKAFDKFHNTLNMNNISNYLKHFSALESISNSGRSAIVLEDDVIIAESFESKLDSILNSSHQMIMFGQPFTTEPEHEFEKISNYNNKVLLPSCESYFVTSQVASNIMKHLLPLAYQTNIGLSIAVNKTNTEVYKLYPNICIDGSKVGKYTSGLNNNNILMYNSKYNELYKIIQNYKVDSDAFMKLYDTAEFNESPDMLYLKGLCLLKSNKIVEAKEVFDIVYSKFCDDGCKLDKTSSFMNNYISFYRVLQQ